MTAHPIAPLVSISVLTFNRCALLERLLRELDALAYRPLEIIVVDNHSHDGTSAMMAARFRHVNYIRAHCNLGAVGRNLGMQAAKGEIVVTLDDDVHGLDDDAIAAVVGRLARDPNIGALNFRVVNDDGHTCNWVHHCKEEDSREKEFVTYEITEGAVAFRKRALERSGYYATRFFLSHEGPDLAFRILDKCFKVIYSPDVVVRHAFAEESRQPWRNYYYDTRNQFWLAARNFPPWYAARYLARGLCSMLAYSLRDGYLRYWLAGVVHGVTGLPQALAERSVLSDSTMALIRSIDCQRPGVAYLIRKRLMTKEGLLMK